ncbi:MAG: penicillin-binding transpeptidase domain-containing protein [Eubacteriales bacterium]|nr:penicillin-binding transpeptidase domain-containing protein [Eubacteriales bacterium]
MKLDKRLARRYAIFALVAMLAFSTLMVSLYSLQIVNADQYQSATDNKRVKTLRVTGKRGMITDADSVVLARSDDIYNVTFYMTSSENTEAHYAKFTPSILEARRIIQQYGGEIINKFVIVRDEDTSEWVFDFGKGISDKAWAIRESQWRGNHYLSNARYPTAEDCYNRLFTMYQLDKHAVDEETALQVMAVYSDMKMNIFNSTPVVIAQDVPYTAVSEITGRSMALAGMDIEVGEKRVYPLSTMASQVIGYVGAISEADNYQTDLKPMGYALNDTIGKDGVERSMENWLTPNIASRTGSRVMERDNQGRLTRQISVTPPTDGNNVKLTLIASYQQQAERAIAANVAYTRGVQEAEMFRDRWRETNKQKLEQRDFNEYKLKLASTGTMVVLDVNTGRVLAMAQHPTYDLNAMVAGGKEVAEILLDERSPLRNYAIQQKAEPGSIFKMVTGLAALTNNRLTVEDRISDEGPYTRYTNKVEDAPQCWIGKGQRSQHANLTIVDGLQKSCNYFFYTITGYLYGDTGSNLLYQYSAKMGLTTRTGVQLPGEARSVVGNQTSLYDPTVSLGEQETSQPILVAASIKKHLKNIGSSYGITYDEVRLDACIKQLMDMAVATPSDQWADAMRPILMAELNMSRDMVWKQAVIGDIWVYLNDIKWGGSLEVQMGIGQSITLLTPVAVSRYVASLGNGGVVYNLSIIDSIISPEGEILNQYQPSIFGHLDGSEQYLPYIREGMKGVVDDQGTAKRYFSNWEYTDEIWAKTGTSQVTVGGIKLDLENNGWFVALTPFSTPAEIAVVVLIPNGKSGAEATRAARDFIEWWMKDKSKFTGDMPVVPGNQLMP